MTAKKFISENRVVAEMVKAQLHCHGELPVVVLQTVQGKRVESTVVAARYNPNSGNVELTI